MRSICVVVLSIVLLAGTSQASDVLQPGTAFPAWELTDHTGAKVASRDLAGKSYLLWFYPKAMTPGCTAEGDALRDQFAAFHARGVEILGVSFDPPADNATFVREQSFPFRLLSDSDRRLAVGRGCRRTERTNRAAHLLSGGGQTVRL